jgi:coenzyme F420-0:L-glutamate ligase/coenzyme F420-1:gamma-L-glutamate ligase
MPTSLQITPVTGIPLLKPGDDLARLIVENAAKQGMRIFKGDIIIIGQKAVSKSEGRIVNIENVRPSKKAQKIALKTGKHPGFVQAVLNDTKRILRADKTSFVVTTIQGATCLNGGADKSNVKGENVYVLLPKNPDASARKLEKRIKKIIGKSVGVIISDSRSRPFRRGQVEEAVGLAGIDPLVDYRGKKDLFGYSLRFKNVNAADELASAAELVMGQGTERTPVAIIRGVRRLKFRAIARPSRYLTVSNNEDLFKGTL